jgi:hypothetical protein
MNIFKATCIIPSGLFIHEALCGPWHDCERNRTCPRDPKVVRVCYIKARGICQKYKNEYGGTSPIYHVQLF